MECWNESPQARPAFSRILQVLNKFSRKSLKRLRYKSCLRNFLTFPRFDVDLGDVYHQDSTKVTAPASIHGGKTGCACAIL